MASLKIQVEFKKSLVKQIQKAPGEVRDAFIDMIEKVQGMTLEDAMADKGLSFEKVISRKNEKLWTLRINRNWRAICLLHTGPVIEIIAVLDHTKAHAIRR